MIECITHKLTHITLIVAVLYVAGLNAALNSLLSLKPVQNTLSIGGRRDFMRNTDLKLQFDHNDLGAGSSGVLSTLQPGFQTGGTVSLFNATNDFLF